MRKFLLAVTAFAVCPTASVSAQNTTCSTWGNVTNCNTQPPYSPPPIPQFDATPLLRADQMRRQREAASRAQVEQQNEELRVAVMRHNAGRLIRDGKCNEALDYMLSNGELSMAAEVKALCAE